METKPIWQSKTFWFAILFGLVNVAGIFGYTTYQPDANTTELVGVGVSVLMILLRYFTTKPIE